MDPFALHHEGIGFSTPRPKCDVVLPFRGQLDYVEQAISSILAQEGVDLTLHLIDDATTNDIDAWLDRQLCDDRVRVYRNRENIGQFLSFNNVVPFCESEWLVTQDGDDVSLPRRLADSIQLAVLCEADLVGAATVLDGPELDTRKLRHMTTVLDHEHRYHRVSFSPRPGFRTYFLENPTLVHRRQCFERLRGFADLADTLRNRTTLDTDYMVRALHAGANIVASRRLAVRYRVHENSAIHHHDTRLGSPIRNQSQAWLSRRISMYARGGIDPAVFGALGRHRGVTVPWKGRGQ